MRSVRDLRLPVASLLVALQRLRSSFTGCPGRRATGATHAGQLEHHGVPGGHVGSRSWRPEPAPRGERRRLRRDRETLSGSLRLWSHPSPLLSCSSRWPGGCLWEVRAALGGAHALATHTWMNPNGTERVRVVTPRRGDQKLSIRWARRLEQLALERGTSKGRMSSGSILGRRKPLLRRWL